MPNHVTPNTDSPLFTDDYPIHVRLGSTRPTRFRVRRPRVVYGSELWAQAISLHTHTGLLPALVNSIWEPQARDVHRWGFHILGHRRSILIDMTGGQPTMWVLEENSTPGEPDVTIFNVEFGSWDQVAAATGTINLDR